MTLYRSNSIYIDDEVMFYAKLRAKQFVKGLSDNKFGDPAPIEQVIECDLRNLWTNAHPEWVVAWEKHEELKAKHRKEWAELEKDL